MFLISKMKITKYEIQYWQLKINHLVSLFLKFKLFQTLLFTVLRWVKICRYNIYLYAIYTVHSRLHFRANVNTVYCLYCHLKLLIKYRSDFHIFIHRGDIREIRGTRRTEFWTVVKLQKGRKATLPRGSRGGVFWVSNPRHCAGGEDDAGSRPIIQCGGNWLYPTYPF